MSSVRLPKGLSANNIIVTPTRGSTRAKNRKRNASPSPTAKTRATTRADVKGTKNVDYDMKHHPMDDTMRPKAAAKRAAVNSTTHNTIGKGSNKSSASGGSKSNTAALKKTTSKSVERKTAANKHPAKQDLSTLLDKPLGDAWSDLAVIDRRIFRLQAGAPAGAETLPFQWPQLATQLDQEGLLTKAQLKACGGINALVERYELIRRHVQKLFGAADEATDRTDFKVLYAEGFDFYDLVGSNAKYVHVTDRDAAAEHTAKTAKANLTEEGEADVQVDGGIAEDTAEPITPTAERTLARSESEEFEEISWEEQVWGLGGIRHEDLHDNNDPIEPMEESREDISALIDDVMMSQDDMSKLYEDHRSQAQPTDIILSDRASTTHSDERSMSIARQEFPSAVWIRPGSSHLVVPVANMTAESSDQVTSPQDRRLSMPDVANPRLGPLMPESVESLTRSAIDHDGIEKSRPGSSSVDREWERERQKKIDEFTKVLSNGASSLMPATPKESTSIATAISPSTDLLVSGQLLEDLRAQGSDASASTVDIQSAVQDAATRSTEASFQVYEDQAGNTPLVMKKVARHPLSPGIDISKENFENDSDVGENSDILALLNPFHTGTNNNQLDQPSLTASPSATGHTQREIGSPAPTHSMRSLFGPSAQANTDNSLGLTCTLRASGGSSLVVATSQPVGDSAMSLVESPKSPKQIRPRASDYM